MGVSSSFALLAPGRAGPLNLSTSRPSNESFRDLSAQSAGSQLHRPAAALDMSTLVWEVVCLVRISRGSSLDAPHPSPASHLTPDPSLVFKARLRLPPEPPPQARLRRLLPAGRGRGAAGHAAVAAAAARRRAPRPPPRAMVPTPPIPPPTPISFPPHALRSIVIWLGVWEAWVGEFLSCLRL